MPTARAGYYTKDKKRVPSVTTITGRFKDSGALIKWAYSQGVEHERLRMLGLPAPGDLYDVSGKAADVGTVVHAMAERHVQCAYMGAGNAQAEAQVVAAQMYAGWEIVQQERVQVAYGAFLNWLAMTRIEFVYTEVAMVSEEHRFGGSLDWIGRMEGRPLLILGDHKTSNGIYSDHLVQVAGYHILWQETHPDEPLEEGAHILRFAKDTGDFAHHHFADLTNEREQFLLLRRAYELDLQIRKRT